MWLVLYRPILYRPILYRLHLPGSCLAGLAPTKPPHPALPHYTTPVYNTRPPSFTTQHLSITSTLPPSLRHTSLVSTSRPLPHYAAPLYFTPLPHYATPLYFAPPPWVDSWPASCNMQVSAWCAAVAEAVAGTTGVSHAGLLGAVLVSSHSLPARSPPVQPNTPYLLGPHPCSTMTPTCWTSWPATSWMRLLTKSTPGTGTRPAGRASTRGMCRDRTTGWTVGSSAARCV